MTTTRDIIDRFERGGEALRRACAGLTREQLVARPGPGAWSILELVVHLQDMDAIAIDRMKRVIAEENPTLLNADENAYVAELFPHEQSMEDVLTLFDAARRQACRTLRALPEEAFDRFGTHNLRGKITLRQLVEGYSHHLGHHLEFLREKRERLGSPTKSATVNAKPTVYLLCGFIGAGKTTFARELEARTGAVRITKDEWLIRLIGNDPTIDGYAGYDHRIVGLSRDVAFQLVEKGIDVILDEGFWAKEERASMRRRIEGLGAEAVLYYLDTPIETMRERVARRSADPPKDAFRISRALLDSYLPYWQPPSEDEGYVLARERR